MATATATRTRKNGNGDKDFSGVAERIRPEFLADDEVKDNDPQTIPDESGEETGTAPENAADLTDEEFEQPVRKMPKESIMKLAAIIEPGKSAVAVLTPDKLKELAFVSTYSDTDPESTSPRQHGYQRDPMESRFPGIGRYYNKGKNKYLIPPLLASVRVYTDKDKARFEYLFEQGDIDAIHREFSKAAVSIVDGQHRMGGLHWAWENIEDFEAKVPVIFYYDQTFTEEAVFFDTVNTMQRKLPKALIEATKVHMEAGDRSHAQIIRELAFALAQDGDSVWKDLVSMTGARHPNQPITYEGLRRATSNMMHERLVNRLKARGFNPEDVLKKYWSMVTRACAPAWENRPRVVDREGTQVEEPVKYRLKDLVGVAAISKLGEDILGTALDKTRSEEDFWEDVSNSVSKLGAVDWEKREDNPWMRSSAGFAGMGVLYDMLYKLVYLDRAPGDSVAPDEEPGEPPADES